MSAKHTAGPWVYGARKDGSLWLSLGDPAKRHYQGDLCASEADARLITAAPELLEALQYVMSAHGEQLTDAFDQAQRAITKATGA